MSTPAREARLWARLREAGQATGDAPARADTPWYLAVLSGAAAWVAAVFLVIFVLDGLHWYRDRSGAMSGLGVACASFALLAMQRARGRVFIEQLAVAFSLGGQLLMGIGLDQIRTYVWRFGSSDTPWLWVAVAAIALVMHAFGRLPLHRFVCGVVFAAGVLGACSADVPALRVVAAPLLAWLALAAWWRSEAHDRIAPVLSPLAWALSLMALLAVGFLGLDDWRFRDFGAWVVWLRPLRDALMLPLLPVCALWLLRRQAGVAPRTLLITLACVLALACWRAPGVTLATTLALVGFALHRPALLVVGIVGIGGYLLRFYFQLDTTLLEKSGWLLAAGAMLLVARVAARRALPAEAAP